jgi:predicted nucleotidyltransferase
MEGVIFLVEDRKVRKKFENALSSFIEEVKKDDNIIAALLFGSLVKGVVWRKSDIDLVLIAKDEKTPYKDYWLMDNEINLQVSVFTRNQFIRHQQRALQGSTAHHVLTTSRILFSNDETIEEFIESMKTVGKRDFELQMLLVIGEVIDDLQKAEKYLTVIEDVAQSYLFIARLLDRFASIVVMLNDTIPGREAVEQAIEFEPALFKNIFTDVILETTDKARVEKIIASIREYLEKQTPAIFKPILDYLREEGTFRSATDIARHLNDRRANDWWYILVLGFGDWLTEQGYLQRVSCPTRLTSRSRREVNEVGFFYVGGDS